MTRIPATVNRIRRARRRFLGISMLTIGLIGCSGSATSSEGSGGTIAVGGGTGQGGTGAGGVTGMGGSVNCACLRGAYVAVCGIDGKTYDATCGDLCVPVAIQCRGQCPCPSGTGGAAGIGGNTGISTDPCGGCGNGQLCILQQGGPGPAPHHICATNAACTLPGPCSCIVNQGTCTALPTGSAFGVICQCDNGMD